MKMPPKPWLRGRQPSYTAFHLRVTICQDEHERVWSEHDFQEPVDEMIAASLPQGGVPQTAFALLTETVVREAYMAVLIELTSNPDFLVQWQAADIYRQQEMMRKLEQTVVSVMHETTQKMASKSVAGVLDMLTKQGHSVEIPGNKGGGDV